MYSPIKASPARELRVLLGITLILGLAFIALVGMAGTPWAWLILLMILPILVDGAVSLRR